MRDGEKDEPVAKAARELQGSSACSVKSAEWSLSDGLLYFRGKIYVLDTSDLRRHIVVLSHDSRLAGHSGRWKTLELVSRNYWWPQMSRYVGRYVSTCDMCLRTKSFQRPPIRELHPLPIPSAPWDTISVDFIVELPQSAGHDSIMVIVDSVTKPHISCPLSLQSLPPEPHTCSSTMCGNIMVSLGESSPIEVHSS